MAVQDGGQRVGLAKGNPTHPSGLQTAGRSGLLTRRTRPSSDAKRMRRGIDLTGHVESASHDGRRPCDGQRPMASACGAHRRRAGVVHRRQPSGAPGQGGGPLRRLHRRGAAAVPAAGLLPQLNPDEWVWKNVKHDGVAPAAPKGPEQMQAVITARLRRPQRLPHLVRGFFGDPELAYITAVA